MSGFVTFLDGTGSKFKELSFDVANVDDGFFWPFGGIVVRGTTKGASVTLAENFAEVQRGYLE